MKKNVLFMILAASVLYSCNINEVSNQNSDNEISIYGNVIDRASGSPLYNVMIELFKHNEENDSDDKVLGSTVTGNDGNYEFTVALDRTAQYDNDAVAYYVRASKDKYTTSLYKLNLSNVDKSNRIKVDFQITVTSIIYAGKVTNTQKKPLVDAKIKAKYYSANSDEDHVRDYGYAIGTTVITDYNGEYKFEVPIPTNNSYLPQWQYLIYAEKDGYITAEHFVNQNVEDMGRNITLNFTMKSVEEQEEEDLKKNYVTIYGKVTDNNGKPILNATIEELNKMNKENEDLTKEIIEIRKKEKERSKDDNELVQIKNEHNAILKELEIKNMKIKILEEEKNESKNLKTKINLLNQQINDVTKKNEEINNKYNRIKESNIEYENSINDLKNNLNIYKNKYEALLIEQQEKNKEQLLIDNKYNQNRYNDLLDNFTKMKSSYEKLNKDYNKLKADYNDLQNENNIFNQELNDINNEKDNINNKYKLLLKQIYFKHKLLSEFDEAEESKEIECEENKMVSCFQTDNGRIVCFYRAKNEENEDLTYYTISTYECCFSNSKSIQIDNSNSSLSFYKGIHLKGDVGFFLYFLGEEISLPFITFKYIDLNPFFLE